MIVKKYLYCISLVFSSLRLMWFEGILSAIEIDGQNPAQKIFPIKMQIRFYLFLILSQRECRILDYFLFFLCELFLFSCCLLDFFSPVPSFGTNNQKPNNRKKYAFYWIGIVNFQRLTYFLFLHLILEKWGYCG